MIRALGTWLTRVVGAVIRLRIARACLCREALDRRRATVVHGVGAVKRLRGLKGLMGGGLKGRLASG